MAWKKDRIERFFKMLMAYANYPSEKVTRAFYFGMIQCIMDELRRNGKVDFPELGAFKLSKKKANNNYMQGPEYVTIVFFKPCARLKVWAKNTFDKLGE